MPVSCLLLSTPLHWQWLALQEDTSRLGNVVETAGAVVGVVTNVIAAGQGAHSPVILAATEGLLRLAGRVPLLGHVAGALQDLYALYQVRCV